MVTRGFAHTQSVVTVSTIAPGAAHTDNFAISDSDKEDSEPWRLAAESSPSLNGEGSTIRRRPGAMLHSRRVGMKQALPYRATAWHPQVSILGLDCRGAPLHWYAYGWAIDP